MTTTRALGTSSAAGRTAATAHELVGEAVGELSCRGVADARLNAEWLLAGLLGVGRFDAYLSTAALDAGVVARYRDLVRRRASGEPLQQLLGWEAFRGLRLRVTRDVLVPRPETETLVDLALALLPPSPATVVDVGTGSGAIACAIAAERPASRVLAIDASVPAAAVARHNASVAGGARGSTVTVVVSDLLGALRASTVDLIVSNPPYLSDAMLAAAPREVREWEPRLALAGGPDGLVVLRPLVRDANRVLRPGGGLVLETAGEPQATAVADLAREAGFVEIETHRDLTGMVRFVAARSGGRASGRGR